MAKRLIAESNAMPQWAKQMAVDNISQVDHVEMQRVNIKNLMELLYTNAIDIIDAQHSAEVDQPQATAG